MQNGSQEFSGVGEGFGGLVADAKLIQVPFDHGDGLLVIAMDKDRCQVRESGELVGIKGIDLHKVDMTREKRMAWREAMCSSCCILVMCRGVMAAAVSERRREGGRAWLGRKV